MAQKALVLPQLISTEAQRVEMEDAQAVREKVQRKVDVMSKKAMEKYFSTF